MRNHNIVIIIFGILTTVLLVGQQFGYTWAGGEGYGRPADVTMTVAFDNVRIDRFGTQRPGFALEQLRRGEIIRTGDGGRTTVQIGPNVELFVDERTDLVLDRLLPDDLSIRLTRGRIFATTRGEKQRLTVTTNFTESSLLKGELSVVNYDFRETVSVIPILDTVVTVVRKPEQGTITQSPIDIHETDPVMITEATFDPDEGAAKDFYAWVREHVSY